MACLTDLADVDGLVIDSEPLVRVVCCGLHLSLFLVVCEAAQGIHRFIELFFQKHGFHVVLLFVHITFLLFGLFCVALRCFQGLVFINRAQLQDVHDGHEEHLDIFDFHVGNFASCLVLLYVRHLLVERNAFCKLPSPWVLC